MYKFILIILLFCVPIVAAGESIEYYGCPNTKEEIECLEFLYHNLEKNQIHLYKRIKMLEKHLEIKFVPQVTNTNIVYDHYIKLEDYYDGFEIPEWDNRTEPKQ